MANEMPPLEAEIRRLISIAGPMPIAQYMATCLSHPVHGYYMTRDPFGAAGDFVTAPEISQMFGELIGLWAATVWRQMGSPESVRLVELGPGRGTMIADTLRAATTVVSGFRSAITVHLVEVSPALQRLQQQTLEPFGVSLLWHKGLEEVPQGPAIILANEFFDALPVHQAMKEEDGWHERVVTLDSNGDFTFDTVLTPLSHLEKLLPRRVREAPPGSIFEWRTDSLALEIGRRVARHGGAALVIDYGHIESEVGDTLQAVGEHAYANPLVTPGLFDITAHVDFQALAQAAESIGARVHGPLPQGEFLRRLGIETRAATLKTKAPSGKMSDIDSQIERLTGTGARRMGTLFKVLGLADPKLGVLPGLEP